MATVWPLEMPFEKLVLPECPVITRHSESFGCAQDKLRKESRTIWYLAMPYYVYLLASRTKRLYVGVTNDLERRVLEHKNSTLDGFTKRYNINRLVYYEEHEGILAAIAREKQVKSWRREKKAELIEDLNAEWDDVSEGWYTVSRDSSLRSE